MLSWTMNRKTKSYGRRKLTKTVAFETSYHCTQSFLRYLDAATLEEGITKGLELLDQFFKDDNFVG